MVWALDLDDFSNSCGNGAFPLLNSINAALGRPEVRLATDRRVKTNMAASDRKKAQNMRYDDNGSVCLSCRLAEPQHVVN